LRLNSKPIARKPRVYARSDLARMEANWVERRKETIANIKSGLVELQIKTVLLKARRLSKVDE
jgi:hypothetical protein